MSEQNTKRRDLLVESIDCPATTTGESERTGKAAATWRIGPVSVDLSIDGDDVFWTAAFDEEHSEGDELTLIGCAETWEEATQGKP